MQDIKSTLYITFRQWFASVLALIAKLFSFHIWLAFAENFAGKLRDSRKGRVDVSDSLYLLPELFIDPPKISLCTIPYRLG